MAGIKPTVLDSFFRGDTPVIDFPLTENGAPFDLSGYFKAFFTMTPNANPSSDADALFQKIISPIPDPTSGILSFQIDKLDTDDADPTKTYYWDLQLEDPTYNYVFTVTYGTFKFLTDYTRTS